jgi:hypothetical protein
MSKNKVKKVDFVLGKTPFLSPFLYFLKKIELFRRKTVRINIFPGIKNSAKKSGSISFCPKISKNRRKKGYVLGKTPFLSPFLYFFKKIELFRRKTVRINIFPGGIKNSAKKSGSISFCPKISKNR